MTEWAVRNTKTGGLVLWWHRLPGGGFTSWSTCREEAEAAAEAMGEGFEAVAR